MRVFTTRGDGIDALRLDERRDPIPGGGAVLVRMSAVALNYRDLLVINGVGHWKPPVDRIPVSDGVGTVVQVGEGVTRVRPGDRVAGIFLPRWIRGELTDDKATPALGGASCDGVMSELRVFDEEAVVRVPDHLTDAEAATLPVAGLTAWHAVRHRSRVAAGQTVLIQGTGGVSLAALQFVHAFGARPLVISSSDEKLERARALGAAVTINYRRVPDWETEVLAATDGAGVDHVLEVVGGENLNRSLRAVRTGGTISFIGLIAGLAGAIDTYRFVMRNATLHGIETGSREMFEEMLQFMAHLRLAPVVDRTYPFEALPEALRRLEAGSHFGKIALTI